MDISKGGYLDKPWQLINGCTPYSPGCDHCWSASMAHRFKDGLTLRGDGPRNGPFDGQIILHPERLSIPMNRKKQTVYAIWNDLFHEDVPDKFRDDAYGYMFGINRHIYLILTKRTENLLRYFKEFVLHGWGKNNIYHGLTVCNQQEADEKIPIFLQVPGKKFLSLEPLLSDISFSMPGVPSGCLWDIQCVILGGETGPGARPMHPDWVRSIRDQCAAAGVPFFFKGWGYWIPEEDRGTVWYERNKTNSRILDMETHDDLPWNIS